MIVTNLPNACAIFNPAAGRGGVRRHLERLKSRIPRCLALWPTERPGHGIDLGRKAANEFEWVLAVGGDGTAHEVANGVLASGRDVVFAPWPVGSANDYAYALGLPGDWPLGDLTGCEVRRVDVGEVTGGGQSRFFINGLGLGFNSAVTLESRSIRWLKGVPLYGWAFVRAVVRHFVAPSMAVALDGDNRVSPTFALSVNLGPREGNLLVTPRAVLDDGEFEIVHAGEATRWEALLMLPKLATGTVPPDHPVIRQLRAKSVAVKSGGTLCVHVDGEFFCKPDDGVGAIDAELLPERLRVVCRPGRYFKG